MINAVKKQQRKQNTGQYRKLFWDSHTGRDKKNPQPFVWLVFIKHAWEDYLNRCGRFTKPFENADCDFVNIGKSHANNKPYKRLRISLSHPVLMMSEHIVVQFSCEKSQETSHEVCQFHKCPMIFS